MTVYYPSRALVVVSKVIINVAKTLERCDIVFNKIHTIYLEHSIIAARLVIDCRYTHTHTHRTGLAHMCRGLV